MFRIKLRLLFFLLFGLAVWASIRMVYIKGAFGKYYKGTGIPKDSTIVVKNRTFSLENLQEQGRRGNICSDDGTILVANIYIYDLYWYPSKVSKADSALFMSKADSLIDIFCQITPEKSRSYYETKVKKAYPIYRKAYNKAEAKIKSSDKKLTAEGLKEKAELGKQKLLIRVSGLNNNKKWVRQRHIDAIDALFTEWSEPKSVFKGGCQKDKRFVRRQLSGGFPVSVLGMFDIKPDKYGVDEMVFHSGLEGFYNKELSGEIIPKQILKVNNNTIRLRKNRHIDPNDGKNVITTINSDIQRITKSALEKQLYLLGANFGAAIVMEVKTGEIKAISNLDLRDGRYVEKNEHTMIEKYEPGSTFKMISLIAALETGKIDTGDIVHCEKGDFSLARAFEISDNEGLFEAVKRSYGDLNAFGFALKTMGLTLDLNLEVSRAQKPTLKTRTSSLADFKNITHGYSINVPPMYMLAYYNAIANDGVYVRPRLVKKIVNPNFDKDNIEVKETEIVKEQLCSYKTVKKVQKCLEGVVTHGTARRVRDALYLASLHDTTREPISPLIAGKTGTAYQNIGGKYVQTKNSSFIGYFPAEAPKYTCYVLISGSTIDAGAAAAPVCKEIAEKLIAHLNDFAQNNQNNVTNKYPSCALAYGQDLTCFYQAMGMKKPQMEENAFVKTQVNAENKILSKPFDFPQKGMPSFEGCNVRDVVFLLEKKGYKTFVRGVGKVARVEYAGKKAYVYLKN